jgi:UTP:GlnB (protein PII) uridylyltransferase
LSLDVVAARLSTVGDIAIDTFYLRTADGQTLGADALRGLCAELAQLIDADL